MSEFDLTFEPVGEPIHRGGPDEFVSYSEWIETLTEAISEHNPWGFLSEGSDGRYRIFGVTNVVECASYSVRVRLLQPMATGDEA